MRLVLDLTFIAITYHIRPQIAERIGSCIPILFFSMATSRWKGRSAGLEWAVDVNVTAYRILQILVEVVEASAKQAPKTQKICFPPNPAITNCSKAVLRCQILRKSTQCRRFHLVSR
jgi:hypothetical protein